MSDVVIKVEDVGKLYKLGEISTGTISHDLKRWWAVTRGKEDPTAKVGMVNDRTQKAESDYVWALKDINFEVKQGEALGIIGRNGAGKSTLLKILSKVTTPSTGQIKVKGRIASLLEVGTGFHPELTGRQNIFLNGAILGMTKSEIKSKFDEIVDFSGVERYIDTPVKRYSSGMYVRLAFAVAAHLEPEILIVDEVLAVGDAEFQKKCLGKMKDVSEHGGRTVLFVSHNMAAVKALCSKGVILKNGQLVFSGTSNDALDEYFLLQNIVTDIKLIDRRDRNGTGVIRFSEIRILNQYKQQILSLMCGEPIYIECKFINNLSKFEKQGVRFDINIYDKNEVMLTQWTTFYQNKEYFIDGNDENFTIYIPKLNLLEGKYSISIYCKIGGDEADWITNATEFAVEGGDFFNTGRQMPAGFGFIASEHSIELNKRYD